VSLVEMEITIEIIVLRSLNSRFTTIGSNVLKYSRTHLPIRPR
jgi:hypothetical protein